MQWRQIYKLVLTTNTRSSSPSPSSHYCFPSHTHIHGQILNRAAYIQLLWIVLVGLIFAFIIQSRSANLGVATGNRLFLYL